MFKNKTFIITGAGSGIGLATALLAYKQHANVVCVDISFTENQTTFDQLDQQRTLFIKCDVSKESDVKKLIHQSIKKFQTIDVLFNNAGIEISDSFHEMSLDSFDKLFDINVKGVFLCSKHAIPTMLTQGKGCIVNTASVASFRAWPEDTAYSATKAAVKLLTQGMALEYAKQGIRVNAVAPGITNTPMTDRALAHHEDLDLAKQVKGKTHPLQRLAEPEEIAQAVLYLASENANFITGVTLPVDGGFLAG